MKYLSAFFLIILCLNLNISCKTTKEKDLKTGLKLNTSNCPSNGVCTFEVLKNQSLEIKKDAIGALYPSLIEGDTHILKFEYKRNEIANTQDGHYSELIYVEIPQTIENIEVSNNDLAKHKILFARLCFCRGQTGYYKITQGNLKLKEIGKGEYNLQLDFKTDEVPQVITSVNETFSLNKKRLN